MPLNKYEQANKNYSKATHLIEIIENSTGESLVEEFVEIIADHKSTTAQAIAGIDDTTIITPAKLKDVVNTLPDVKVASGVVSGTDLILTMSDGTTRTIDVTSLANVPDIRLQSGVYNPTTQALDFTLSNGTIISVPVAALLPVTHDLTLTGDGATVPLSVPLSADPNNTLIYGTDGRLFNPLTVTTIPTPRIWARNKGTQLTSGTDANSVTNQWSMPEIYAQTFYPEDAAWKNYNPIYELVVHKLVRKASGSNLRGYKWVHPVNNNANNTGKKFAGGRTWDQTNNTPFTDRQTEWNIDISTKETWLKALDPHKYCAVGNQPLTVAGSDPLVGAIPEGSFLRKIYFTPRTGNKTKHKMAFGIRIRIDNPNFQAGVPNQDPYIYGDVSNILVFRPKMYNLWDGSTVDFQGNNVLSHYFFDWVATEENSTQN